MVHRINLTVHGSGIEDLLDIIRTSDKVSSYGGAFTKNHKRASLMIEFKE